jgi:arginyl-tRNA synthetase
MQTIASQLEQAFRAAIQTALGFDADPLVGVAQNEKFGDYQSNAAMGLARQVAERTGQKTNPRAVAEQVKAAVTPLLGELASEVTIAGPGFINVRLNPAWLGGRLQGVAREHRLLPPLPDRHRQRVVVDYSAPNVAKELHVGHLRSTIIGDAVARVLAAQGHDVIRQNHIGDWGTQFGMLIAHLRSLGDAAQASSAIEDLNALYVAANGRFKSDEQFATEARETVVRLQGGAPEERAVWEQIVDASRRYYTGIYEQLGVKLTRDDERGESSYNAQLADVVRDLTTAGVATESDGATVVFVDGFEAPLIIRKSGGGYLYATTDLAAIRYRVGELRARRIIYVVGAPQSQHFAQLFAAAREAGWARDVQLEHAAFGSVLGEDGKLLRSRAGNAVKLKDLLNEAEERAFAIVTEKSPDTPEEQRRRIAKAVGIGAVKYADLSKERTTDYIFAWDRMLAFEGNTAPYLQNAYVRIHGIFRKARAGGLSTDVDPASIRLESPFELALAKHVLRIGEVVDLVARELKPHHLCNYLYELATQYHAFFENCPVLQSDESTRASRLALCSVVAETLAFGLDLLGIEHPEQM